MATQTIGASQSGHSRDLVQASAARAEQGLGCAKALGDEPLAGGSACRLVEATKEGAGTHPTFRRHTGDRPTSGEIGPHPIEQRGDVDLLSHPHGPLEKLRLPAVPPADSRLARRHFASEFAYETDCWDVHDSLSQGADFVLLDVRSPALFAKGHVPGAINLPHGKIVASKKTAWPEGAIFVTYCAGPHCNGAARGALRLAELGRPVKITAGGVTRWPDEGFELAAGETP